MWEVGNIKLKENKLVIFLSTFSNRKHYEHTFVSILANNIKKYKISINGV